MMRARHLVPVVALHIFLAGGLAGGCAGSDPERCATNEDCPSGLCRADRTCAPVDDAPDADDAPDGGDDAPDGPAGCQPDHDGTITRAELPLAPGRTATYRVALDVDVDTAGQLGAGGARTWDLAAALSGDADVELSLLAPADQWWADAFPTATYATRLSAEADLLGVFELTDTRLRLLGVVSPAAGTFRTELTYDPPVDVLVLPLAPSATWEVDTTVTGLAQGVASIYTESYASRVDALGTLDTPYGPFPVSRVAVDLTRTVGALVTTRRTFSWIAECYSTVATVSSQDYEDGAEFTDASEVRRLAP